ncbi:uncharacterized protein LOC130990586 [Salvia miltiorrhiza]|uniref:uncharacterized protein LOC130990586 n=1 Tax=Salvia miltiorrhiza TaxID=226208 RepID=UPI0025ACA147|nr:uncharacterized protein LOC130990586 [Salvia miltiorrhiza]
MEKLRKRYRAEIQQRRPPIRLLLGPLPQHALHGEGLRPTLPPSSSSSDEDEDTKTNIVKRINDLYNRHTNGSGSTSTPGVNIKMPGAASANPNPNPRIIPPNSSSGSKSVVEAIQALGEGFMRMEKMKMEMAQQIEEMRMEMEEVRDRVRTDMERGNWEGGWRREREKEEKFSGMVGKLYGFVLYGTYGFIEMR